MTDSNPVYLDYNATTPCDERVVKEMLPFFTKISGNPSSSHRAGREAAAAITKARAQIASLLNCTSDEIVFTSGGTESNNWALRGIELGENAHVVTSAFEHPAISVVLAAMNVRATRVPVDSDGLIDVEALRAALSPDTALVTVMLANNELGTIQPIAEISRIVRDYGKKQNKTIYVHTDASQACGKIPIDVQELGVDLLTIAGHKLYAPKGVGALFIRNSVKIQRFLHGADHEKGLRAGTENVPYIVALGKAAELARTEFLSNEVLNAMADRRDRLFSLLKEGLENVVGNVKVKRNGTQARDKVLPNTLSVALRGVEAAPLLVAVENDVCASAGAACHSGDEVCMSKTLESIGLDEIDACGTLRLSLGRHTTDSEIERAAQAIIATAKAQIAK